MLPAVSGLLGSDLGLGSPDMPSRCSHFSSMGQLEGSEIGGVQRKGNCLIVVTLGREQIKGSRDSHTMFGVLTLGLG